MKFIKRAIKYYCVRRVGIKWRDCLHKGSFVAKLSSLWQSELCHFKTVITVMSWIFAAVIDLFHRPHNRLMARRNTSLTKTQCINLKNPRRRLYVWTLSYHKPIWLHTSACALGAGGVSFTKMYFLHERSTGFIIGGWFGYNMIWRVLWRYSATMRPTFLQKWANEGTKIVYRVLSFRLRKSDSRSPYNFVTVRRFYLCEQP